MKPIIKRFSIKKDEIWPDEINEKLMKHYSVINNRCLEGDLYRVNGKEVLKGFIRYHMNFFDISTDDKIKNYQIKSELEKILDTELVETKVQ